MLETSDELGKTTGRRCWPLAVIHLTGTGPVYPTGTCVKQSLRARLRAGDPEAFRQLFQELGQAIYAHAYRATGDWSAAEDAVSLTFL
ncbi:RNA polymerase sigma factor, partial [Streptomyces sp. NPDC088358]|uniref:RNA polymerase sigma factor n=1 Tax=Streptomyces sp. NPDC088358 TaxID=3365857 RepID=UPI00382399DC